MSLQQRIGLFLTLVATGIALTGTAGEPIFAQAQPKPQPDRNGNYFSNDAPMKGTAPSPLMAGSLWQVVSVGLNCRRGAGTQHGIARQFKRGELLQADVGRGGADEVLLNVKDSTGQPWMRVRSAKDKNFHCYVRANRLYIKPYQS